MQSLWGRFPGALRGSAAAAAKRALVMSKVSEGAKRRMSGPKSGLPNSWPEETGQETTQKGQQSVPRFIIPTPHDR